MPNRKYPFALPIHLSGMECGGACHLLKEDHVWEKLPKSVQKKLEEASFWTGVDLVKADLDSIDNKTYASIQALLKARGY